MTSDLPWGPGLRQPDRLSCGPACVVVSRMLRDPSYAEEVTAPTGVGQMPRRFGDEVRAVHRTVRAWPRLLGTPPWELARLLGRHRVVPARLGPSAAWPAAVPGACLYVGSPGLPRHVVLVLEAEDDDRVLYDPAHGGRVRRGLADAVDGLRLSGWDRLWCVVAPVPEP